MFSYQAMSPNCKKRSEVAVQKVINEILDEKKSEKPICISDDDSMVYIFIF